MPRQGIMLAYKYDERRRLKWKPPYIVQPKYDGERCRAIINRGNIILFSSGGKVINSVPHINEQLAGNYLPITKIELDGELYKHGMDVDSIHSIVRRTVNIHKDHEIIEYHIFDFIHNNPQLDRVRYLDYYREHIETDDIKVTKSVLCDTIEEVYATYDRFISEGYEGIIIRNAQAPYIKAKTTMMMKMKPFEVGEFIIIGMNQEISIEGEPKDSLGAFVCKTKEGEEFKVGSGPFLTRVRRINLWRSWTDYRMPSKMLAKIKYQELTTDRKVPRFPTLLGITGG